MSHSSYEKAYGSWRKSLIELTASDDALSEWQDRRYRFAHQLGALLTGEVARSGPIAGAVLYGIYLPGVGLVYVGQTQEAERRLRDLPVGESHHLANTIPPELWERVIIVRWPSLLDELDPPEREAVSGMGLAVCGLALEHLVQVAACPPLNARRRTPAGQWQPRRPTDSRSRGALNATLIPGLYDLVWRAWTGLANEPLGGEASVRCSEHGRVVFPQSMLSDG